MQHLVTFLSALTLVPALLAQGPPLLAHWRFDETAGTTATDSSPSANHGQLINFGGAQWVAGQIGNALQFDGADDYVLIPSNPTLPVYDGLGTPFSIAFWVKAPAQSDRRIYSEQMAAPPNSGPLFTLGSGSGTNTDRLRVYIRDDGIGTVIPTTGTSLGVVFDDTWHHVVYTDHSGRVRIYIDGALDTVLDYSRWAFGPRSSLRGTFTLDSVTLGAVVRNGGIAAPLNGLVDDLRVYGSILDALDAQLLFQGTDPPAIAGSVSTFGYGCGQGPLDLAASGSASYGGTVYAQVLQGEPGALVLVAIGLGAVQPVDLATYGFPGCTLYQQPVATALLGALGPAGSSTPFAFAVPTGAGVGGTLLTFQGVALGAAVEFSPAAIAQLGR